MEHLGTSKNDEICVCTADGKEETVLITRDKFGEMFSVSMMVEGIRREWSFRLELPTDYLSARFEIMKMIEEAASLKELAEKLEKLFRTKFKEIVS